jgi:replication factor A1
MCPEDRCGKKVVDENNGTYRCEKCNKTYNNFKWAYMLSVRVKYCFGISDELLVAEIALFLLKL